MRRSFIIGTCLLFCHASGDVLAQSLTNGSFDTDVSGWTPSSKSTVVWDALDADASPTSGSALVTNQSDTANDSTGATQCVDGLIGGATYRFGAEILVPAGPGETGRAHLLVQWYDDFCGGHQSGAAVASIGVMTSTPDVWYTDHGTFVAPADTRFARIRLSVWKDAETGTLDGQFDNVSFSLMAHHLSFVSAAGLAHGDAGSFWVTDVDVNNPSNSEAMTYELWWLPRGEDNFEPVASAPFNLGAGRSIRHENVLGEVFGLDPGDAPFGAVAVASDGAGALAMARVFNQPEGGGGTFGQSMPGVPAEAMILRGERLRILFMSEDDAFRANVGCQNGTGNDLQVTIELFDGSGNSYGLQTMELAPFSNNQINRIFRDWAPVIGYVDVWSNTVGARFYCYGSVLDNTSSDPTTVLPQ